LLFGFGCERGFELIGFEVDCASGNFFFAGSAEAELADAEAVAGGQRWSEGATGDGARCVEIAEAGSGIESGTGFFVGEIFEGVGAVGIEQAGADVAGKCGRETRDGLLRAGSHCGGSLRIGCFEGAETEAEPRSIELRDGEDADAALGASWTAFEVGSGTAGRVGYSGIDDLYELRIEMRIPIREHGIRVVESRGD
jgi:hypothetical protein